MTSPKGETIKAEGLGGCNRTFLRHEKCLVSDDSLHSLLYASAGGIYNGGTKGCNGGGNGGSYGSENGYGGGTYAVAAPPPPRLNPEPRVPPSVIGGTPCENTPLLSSTTTSTSGNVSTTSDIWCTEHLQQWRYQWRRTK
ncbi:hypothetical protein COOONC_22992 [Cooperia oncophora]